MDSPSVPKDILERYLELGKEIKRTKETNQNKFFKPYEKQAEFLHSKSHIKVLFGCNRGGKTHTESYEISLHLTGEYPDDWKGVRFDHPIDVWAVGYSADRVRDTIQEKLFGKHGAFGTGMIPLGSIDGQKVTGKPGIPGAIDRAYVKHKSGGLSSIQFFSYKEGSSSFMGSSIKWIWFDEEPPSEIFNECKMRILDNDGYIAFTFTPLDGITPLYNELIEDDDVCKVWLTIDDAKHIDLAKMDYLYRGMSEAERTARKYGVATIGRGKVFQFEESDYITEDFEIPKHWRRIGSLDIGLSHPTAAVALAIDDHAQCLYIYNEYLRNGESPQAHAAVLKNWNLEFAIDPSAFNRQIGSMVSPASLYRDEGMVVFKAINDVDASIERIRILISEGRFWIFSSCANLIREFKLYRTKEGADGKTKIVKINDDLIDAMRYAVMAADKASIPGKRKIDDVKVVEWRLSNDKYGGT